MTFRGVVRDGLIIIDTRGDLPEGTRVRVVAPAIPRSPSARSTARKAAPKPGGKAPNRKAAARRGVGRRTAPTDLGFGMWKHRADITDTVGFARALRTKVSRRGA